MSVVKMSVIQISVVKMIVDQILVVQMSEDSQEQQTPEWLSAIQHLS